MKLPPEQQLSVECGACGGRIRTSVGWVLTHPTLGCTACAAIFETALVLKLVDEATRAAARAGRGAPDVLRVRVPA